MELIKLAAAAILKKAAIIPWGPSDWYPTAQRWNWNNPFSLTGGSHRARNRRWQNNLPLKDIYQSPPGRGSERNVNLTYPNNIDRILSNIVKGRSQYNTEQSANSQQWLDKIKSLIGQ